MQVFVIDKNKRPLMPCAPGRARELLTKGKAAVFRFYPFTIILKEREEGNVQELEIKLDPGSKTTGIALVKTIQKTRVVIWAANLHHRGHVIRSSLESRKSLRRGRRHRKTRYRAARFNNRRRRDGLLAPSLQSRVDNVSAWVARLRKLAPISSVAIETARFDMQKIQDPEITGTEYQQGELMGYEVREYLLEKWGHKCAYCGEKETRLEIDHIEARSKGGSNRVSNLTIACRDCNVKKSNTSLQEFLKNKPDVRSKILSKAQAPLKDAAAVNTIRYAIGESLRSFDTPITFWSGGRTKYNRTKQSYDKDHWIDAACVGKTGEDVQIAQGFSFLNIKATGRGYRQSCRVDQYGFPRTSGKQQKRVHGFKTGDIVKAVVTKGKKSGSHVGRVSVRSSGNFCVDTRAGKVDGISHKYCKAMHSSDGYHYFIQSLRDEVALPLPKKRGLMPSHYDLTNTSKKGSAIPSRC